ncbi:MAG: hypothetical protein IJ661_09270 [Lachnospiraceae bacterium]|nr:hypothetical protein [Lachnospiraceae bacterium]
MEKIFKLLIEKLSKNSTYIFNNYKNDYNNINKKYENSFSEDIDFVISCNNTYVITTTLIFIAFGLLLLYGTDMRFLSLILFYCIICILYPIILNLKPKIKVKNDYLIYKSKKYYYYDISKITKSPLGITSIYCQNKRLFNISVEYINYGSFLAWAGKHNIPIIDKSQENNTDSKLNNPKILMLIITFIFLIIMMVFFYVIKPLINL